MYQSRSFKVQRGSTNYVFRYVASIGALIMILANGFDASLQQTLSIGQQTQALGIGKSNLTAENILPRTVTYFHGEAPKFHN